MSTKTRQSKYRHVYGDPAKPEGQYAGIKTPLSSGEGQYLKANHKYLAFATGSGGGPLYVHPLANVGRFPINAKHISLHKGKTVDWDFHPFISTMIATGSEDCSCAVAQFPEGGMTTAEQNLTTPAAVLKGHSKKVALVKWHPCANNILASGAYDRTVRIWDVEKQLSAYEYADLKDNVYSLEWNKDGSRLAVTGKDKKLRLFDPRAPDGAEVVDAFEGTKSSKCFWCPNLGWVGSTGYSKTAKRQLKIWDEKDLSKPVFSLDIDSASSVLMPFFDDSNSVLYLSGKGDGSVSYYEILNDDRKVHYLSLYRNTEPQKGGGWVPKKGLDVWKCEVSRFLKLTSKNIVPISFLVPRKVGADVFQEDIFPDCYAGKQAMSAEEYQSGENRDPITMSMDPAKRGDADDESGATFVAKKTYDELATENEQLKARVAELEKQLGIDNNETTETTEES